MDRPGKTLLSTGHRRRRMEAALKGMTRIFFMQASRFPQVARRARVLLSLLVREASYLAKQERALERTEGDEETRRVAAALGVPLAPGKGEPLERVDPAEAKALLNRYEQAVATEEKRAG